MLEKEIKQKALKVGLDLVGITTADPVDQVTVQRFQRWLEQNKHGDMTYLRRNLEKRLNPKLLLPGAKSIICAAINYKPSKEIAEKPGCGKIANYALYDDYHDYLKGLLFELLEVINKLFSHTSFQAKICVDSVPIAERYFASRAGLGFIGKNHMLIHPDLGSQIFLGEIIVDLELEPEPPFTGDCGSCDRCIQACPTGALQKDGFFHAQKCISYLTIEHKGEIPESSACTIGNRLFGCDECVKACPYNETAPSCKNGDFKYHPERRWLGLKEILILDKVQFYKQFRESPIERLGMDRLKRNAGICLSNLKN